MELRKKKQRKNQTMYVEFSKIIVFPQVRQTFDLAELRLLANDIAINELIQPSIVARLSPKNFFAYKKAFEEISDHIIEGEFPFTIEDDEKWYYVLIAGERRYRAHAILWHEGCEECQREAAEQNRRLLPGECFEKHMDGNEMEVRASTNIDPMKAKSIQFRENLYIKPPLHEEAYAYQQYYQVLKRHNPKITTAAFARAVGVSVEKIRRALWFCELPEKVQEAVRSGLISYSHAIELKRLLDTKKEEERNAVAEQELVWLLMNPKFKVEDYRKRIQNTLESQTIQSLFATDDLLITKVQKRRVVEERLIPVLGTHAQYVQKVMALIERGELGSEKIFSGISPTFQLKRIVDVLQELFPDVFKLTEEQTKMLKHANLDKPKKEKRA